MERFVVEHFAEIIFTSSFEIKVHLLARDYRYPELKLRETGDDDVTFQP